MDLPAGAVTPGSIILAILALMSLASIALIVSKLLQLRGTLAGRRALLRALDDWRAGTAFQVEDRTPAGLVLRGALEALDRGVPRPALEQELERLGNAQVEWLGRSIRTLEVIAIVSPLLGLLGTVLGMIVSFQSLEMAGSAANASVLAGGIWQALLTTAAGLVVAIPAAAAAALASARVERVAAEIEDVVARLFVLLDTPAELRGAS